jgi:competence protein ComEC
VVLIAVMVDRRAVTFRTLAVAAVIVLVLAPEAKVTIPIAGKLREG